MVSEKKQEEAFTRWTKNIKAKLESDKIFEKEKTELPIKSRTYFSGSGWSN